MFFSLAIALLITLILSQTLFFFNSPRLNPFFLAKLKKDFLALFSKKNSYGKLASTPLSAMTPISQGVFAKEDKELGTLYIKVTKEAERSEQILESNGKKIKIIYIK
jgi:hypothetical protein